MWHARLYFLGATELLSKFGHFSLDLCPLSEALLYILIILVFSGCISIHCPEKEVVMRYEVVLISEVENVLFPWQSQLGARCLSIVWR